MDADRLREYVAKQGKTRVQQDHQNAIARDFKNVTVIRDLAYTDDRDANRIESRVEFRVSPFWDLDDDRGYVRTLYPCFFLNQLHEPKTVIRKTPLRITYPQKWTETIVVEFPEARKGDVSDGGTLTSRAFRHEWDNTSSDDGKVLTFTHRYEALKDMVPPERMPEYLQAARDSFDVMYHDLYHPLFEDGDYSEDEQGSSPLKIPAIVCLILLALVLAYVLGKRLLSSS
jgi:hypothetical protein